MCVREREREYSVMPNSPTNYPTPVYTGATGRERERERERSRERESVCVCVSECLRKYVCT